MHRLKLILAVVVVSTVLCGLIVFLLIKGNPSFSLERLANHSFRNNPEKIDLKNNSSTSLHFGVVDGPQINDEGIKQQIRGKLVSWGDNGITVSLGDGKIKLVRLQSQVQYACLPSEMERMDGKGYVPLSSAYINLTNDDGLGEMVSIKEIKQEIAIDDEVIVVGVTPASGGFVGRQVFTMKCSK